LTSDLSAAQRAKAPCLKRVHRTNRAATPKHVSPQGAALVCSQYRGSPPSVGFRACGAIRRKPQHIGQKEGRGNNPNALALTCQDELLLAPHPPQSPLPQLPRHRATSSPTTLGEGGSELLAGDNTPTSPAGGWPPPEPPLTSFLCNTTGGHPSCSPGFCCATPSPVLFCFPEAGAV